MEASQGRGRTIATTIAVYVAWLVSALFGVAVLITWHSSLLRLYVAFEWNKYGIAAFNNTVALVLALIWLVVVIVLETWYRHAGDLGNLGRRFGRVTFAQVALTLLAWVVGRL
jgi:hypothetical protein